MSVLRGQPDRDLQCYFQTNASHDYMYAAHTGIAAITKASSTDLTLTGTFHDQFDWSVIEWNRDNQYEHLALRNLPNGDFTGLTISYRESRSANCIQPDSRLYDWQDWSRIRLFCGKETQPRKVLLRPLLSNGPNGAKASVTFNATGYAASNTEFSIDFLGDIYSYTTGSLSNSLMFGLDDVLKATENGQYFKVAFTGPDYTHIYEYTASGITPATGNVLTFTFAATSSAAGQYVKIALTGPDYNHIYEFTSTASGQSFAQALADAMSADTDCPMTPSVSAGTITLTAKGVSGGSYQASCFNVTDFIYHSGDPWWNWNDVTNGTQNVAPQLKALMDADPDCPMVATLTNTANGTPVLVLRAKGITGGAYQASCWVIDRFIESSPENPWWDWTDVGGTLVSEGITCDDPKMSEITVDGTAITLTAKLKGEGLNGVVITAIGDVWDENEKVLEGGEVPDYYVVTIPFDSLEDENGDAVPVTDIRAIRWTYSSKMVNDVFEPLDYTVDWTSYSATGTKATYKYAGKYSQVIHCEDKDAVWSGYYERERGNFVGGAIAYFDHTSTSVSMKYNCPKDHDLYVGSRFLEINGTMKVTVDGGAPKYFDLFMTRSDIGWDRVCRLKVGSFGPGKHTVVVTSKGESLSDINEYSQGYRIFFNYIQAVVESDDPVLDTSTYADTTLATDWDTAHSLELSPQRVVWNLRTLGFTGRTNHYVGALKWYRLKPVDGTMATGWFQLAVDPDFATAKSLGEGITIKIDSYNITAGIRPSHSNLTALADSLVETINSNATSVWASVDETTEGKILIHARRRSGGAQDPADIVLDVTSATHLQVTTSGSLDGGVKYNWVVDKEVDSPVNAATAAWTKSYLETLHTHGMSAVLALSQELAHEPKTSSLAAKYSDDQAVWLNTPALQTNFSPDTGAYFRKAFEQLAQVMASAGVQPFLQFGECQWWYFATRWDGAYWQTASSLGVYDDYTVEQFGSRYGGTMHIFKDDYDRASPGDAKKTAAQVKTLYPHECELLSSLIGEYTSGIIDYVKATVPTCKFEVLYPLDVNDGSVPNNINQPPALHWGSGKLDAFKTEGFGYMFSKNLAQLQTLIKYPFETRNFTRANSRCLLGSYDNTDPFERALMEAKAEGTGDKVLWAFDQFSMRSFRLPLFQGDRYVVIVSW